MTSKFYKKIDIIIKKLSLYLVKNYFYRILIISFFSILLILFFSICIFFIILHWDKINFYLLKASTNSGGQLFFTVAASIVGVITIAFSLAVFSIQHAADRGTTKVLSEFRRDPIYIGSFWTLAAFSIIIFSFSFLPYRSNWIFIEYSITFIFLFSTFIILFKLFYHTIDMVDDTCRIQLLYNKISKHFSKISNNINKAIQRSL